jgi:hypothetical protein
MLFGDTFIQVLCPFLIGPFDFSIIELYVLLILYNFSYILYLQV